MKLSLPPAATTCRPCRPCRGGGVQLANEILLPCRKTFLSAHDVVIVAIRLVEETEAHVVVGLLLLCKKRMSVIAFLCLV